METPVLDLPAPVAARLRRPGWRDPRLLVGVVLVAASVALGSWAVGAAQRTVPVWVARDVLAPGDTLRASDLVVADVRIGAAVDGYLRADRGLPDDRVVLRTVGAGELVPLRAVGRADALEVRPVPVPLEGPRPATSWPVPPSTSGGRRRRTSAPRVRTTPAPRTAHPASSRPPSPWRR
ncbi:hypothetical protein [Cellulomonas sp. JZ18]|uniref:hypothetical protein n=1 Tax=Cellulomonas sp. JZ18 TaxID=2654191 RepID=UPI00351ACA27